MSASMSRRGFLSLAIAGVTAAGLAACSGQVGGAAGVKKGGAELSAKLKLPTYVPAKVPTPDLPGSAQGIDPAYLKYPKELVKSVAAPPGDGSKITALTETFNTPAPPMAQNAYWQELNKRLGSEFDMTIVVDDYPAKFNAVIASDDIPDLVWFPPNQGLQRVPELLEAKFHDLTPHLSGDAVKKYPNLANIPEYAWKTAVMNGKIVGVAVAYGIFGQVFLTNTDFWQPVGGTAFTSADDFLAKAKTLLDAKRKKYVLEPAYTNMLHMFSHWYGAPNTWRLEGGKLVHQMETAEYQAAIEFTKKVYDAGLFWPDPKLTTTPEKVANGSIGAYVQSFPGFILDAKTVKFPLGVIKPFAATPGSKPVFNAGYGSVGFTAINKKADPKRVEMLLNVMNYLAAPFGTEEAQFINFGVEGTHFTKTADGDIAFTPKGEAEAPTTWQPVSFLVNSPEYIYIPSKPDAGKLIHEFETTVMPIMQPRITVGHFSDTFTAKGAELTTMLSDGLDDVITGRKPMSFVKTLTEDWKKKGGDAMRAEYEASLAKG
ncbi:hypothetical protein ACQPYK_45260 [Streptosporangium sp. CA-135522]|uniref:hypothetical protein n=1 Tax=Streptosporangium sp. CA-135522 TaxID=3240072 RepID=UPI003D8C9DCA